MKTIKAYQGTHTGIRVLNYRRGITQPEDVTNEYDATLVGNPSDDLLAHLIVHVGEDGQLSQEASLYEDSQAAQKSLADLTLLYRLDVEKGLF